MRPFADENEADRDAVDRSDADRIGDRDRDRAEPAPHTHASVDRWHVLLAPGTHVDPARLAAPYAALLGGTTLDAARALRYAHGWVATDRTRDAARAVLDLVSEAGGAGFMVPADTAVAAAPVQRVRTAILREGTLELTTRSELAPLPIAQIACADLAVLGTPGADADAKQRWRDSRTLRGKSAADRSAAAATDWAPFVEATFLVAHPVRRALRELDLENAEPLLHLVTRDPVSVLGFERATRFPAEGALAGMAPNERWFHFVDRLLATLPPGKVLPEAQLAWSRPELSAIAFHRRESLDQRLRWLVELVGRDLWKEFR